MNGLSKNELIRTLEIIDAAARCNTREEFKEALCLMKELVGADYCIAAFGDMNWPQAFNIIKCDYPSAWVNQYFEEKYYNIDPVVRYHRQYTMVFDWADSFRAFDGKKERGFLNEARSYGIKYGVTGGIYSPVSGMTSIVSFAHKNAIDARYRRAIDRAAPHLHGALERVLKTM
ncbi:MAG: autoinducer binding domain-containing protein [Deltaproteobacteria bacterium]|nr:autoinducer binding domain-containing protein [Deltaproteobacteria bacterium]